MVTCDTNLSTESSGTLECDNGIFTYSITPTENVSSNAIEMFISINNAWVTNNGKWIFQLNTPVIFDNKLKVTVTSLFGTIVKFDVCCANEKPIPCTNCQSGCSGNDYITKICDENTGICNETTSPNDIRCLPAPVLGYDCDDCYTLVENGQYSDTQSCINACIIPPIDNKYNCIDGCSSPIHQVGYVSQLDCLLNRDIDCLIPPSEPGECYKTYSLFFELTSDGVTKLNDALGTSFSSMDLALGINEIMEYGNLTDKLLTKASLIIPEYDITYELFAYTDIDNLRKIELRLCATPKISASVNIQEFSDEQWKGIWSLLAFVASSVFTIAIFVISAAIAAGSAPVGLIAIALVALVTSVISIYKFLKIYFGSDTESDNPAIPKTVLCDTVDTKTRLDAVASENSQYINCSWYSETLKLYNKLQTKEVSPTDKNGNIVPIEIVVGNLCPDQIDCDTATGCKCEEKCKSIDTDGDSITDTCISVTTIAEISDKLAKEQIKLLNEIRGEATFEKAKGVLLAEIRSYLAISKDMLDNSLIIQSTHADVVTKFNSVKNCAKSATTIDNILECAKKPEIEEIKSLLIPKAAELTDIKIDLVRQTIGKYEGILIVYRAAEIGNASNVEDIEDALTKLKACISVYDSSIKDIPAIEEVADCVDGYMALTLKYIGEVADVEEEKEAKTTTEKDSCEILTGVPCDTFKTIGLAVGGLIGLKFLSDIFGRK